MNHIYTDLPTIPLAKEGILSILVWNIYKQKRANWITILEEYGQKCQLILLQEAASTPELIDFATSYYPAADQAAAIYFPYPMQISSGVMTLSSVYADYCQPLFKSEPLLRLNKSALVSIYRLSNNQTLMVINIHAINFSLGVWTYTQQLEMIHRYITNHDGPVIFAGDFNTWSHKRIELLYQRINQANLHEVIFEDDYRIKIFGLPIDFIFYRGFNLLSESVIKTDSSDHNPLFVQFGLIDNK